MPAEWYAHPLIELAIKVAELVVLGVLAWITHNYAKSTAAMTTQVERQTESMQEQSIATKETAELMRLSAQQHQEATIEQRQMGEAVLALVIRQAIRRIEQWGPVRHSASGVPPSSDWKERAKHHINNVAALHQIPDPFGLVPEQSQQAMNHAIRVGHPGLISLTDGIETLRECELLFHRLRSAQIPVLSKLVWELVQKLDDAKMQLSQVHNRIEQQRQDD